MIYFLSTFKRIIKSVSFTLLSFLFLYLIFDTIEHVRIVLAYKSDLSNLFTLAFLHIPTAIYQLVPIAVFFGCLYIMLQMTRDNELLILSASGQSLSRRLAPFVAVAVLSSFLMIIWGDTAVPMAEKDYRKMIDIEIKHKDTWGNKYHPQKNWFAGPSGIWRIGNSVNSEYLKVDLHKISESGKLNQRIKADKMFYREGKWQFVNLKVYNVDAAKYEVMDPADIIIPESRDHFEIIWTTAEEMSVSELLHAIELSKQQGINGAGYQTTLLGRFSLPLLSAFLPFSIIPFVWSRKRILTSSKLAVVMLGIVICLLFFATIKLTQALSISGVIDPAISVLTVPIPLIIFVLLTIAKAEL